MCACVNVHIFICVYMCACVNVRIFICVHTFMFINGHFHIVCTMLDQTVCQTSSGYSPWLHPPSFTFVKFGLSLPKSGRDSMS